MSPEGIQLRTNRSIQVEGAFGVLKQDFQFRRLLHRGNDHVRKMLYLLAMGFNISKLQHRIPKITGYIPYYSAKKNCVSLESNPFT